MEQKEEQMVIALGSEIGLPFQVWHDEKQQWFKSESNEPIRDRNIPRPTYRTVLVNAPKGGCRSERIPIPPESPGEPMHWNTHAACLMAASL